MRPRSGFAFLSCALVLFLFGWQTIHAQSFESGVRPRPLISQTIDENKRVTLAGNTRPEVTMQNDRGNVAADLRMEHMLLQLKRSPELETALEQFVEELQTPGSPNFHQWISAQEFGARFGVAARDISQVMDWLLSHGLSVDVVYPSGMVIDFSGTAVQVESAFGTRIHKLDVNGRPHIANISDPQIPAALAPVVAGVVSLHDFPPRTMHKMRGPSANFTFSGGGGPTFAMVPEDLATIYNLDPVFAAGYSGQGQTIVLVEDTDVFSTNDWSTFRSTFGLASYTGALFTSVYPAPPSGSNNCGAPGITPDDSEAILDAEWASAAAPSAAIEIAACANTTTTFGGLIAVQNLLNAPNPPAVMSISYGECETFNGAAANAAFNSAYQLAVTQGVSVFVSAGDSGAAVCDNGAAAATDGIGVSGFASTPYNVAVGGTDFSDTFSNTNSTYWNSSNTSLYGSAFSYVPEIPWNDSCAGALLVQFEGYPSPYGPNSLCNDPFLGPVFQLTVAGSGGPSGCATGAPSSSTPGVVSGTCTGWPKPAWQKLMGNPNDGVRDTPDVSLFAANGLWGHYYVFCWSDLGNGGTPCTADPSLWSAAGGTSFSSPIMAGIQALVNQRTGSRQGNPNPAYYQLAASEYGSGGSSSCNSSKGTAVSPVCIFYDVTQGDMAVNCIGTANCYLAGTANGVLSTSNNAYQPAYGTGIGWDFATGIGTVNAANLVFNWPGLTSVPKFVLSVSPASVTLVQGTKGTSKITVTGVAGFTGNVSLSASGMPSGVSASFSSSSTSASSTLTLTSTLTAAIGAFPITVTGTSGSLLTTVTVFLTINPAPVPNFTLAASPNSLSIVQGGAGTSTITVTPLNGFSGGVSLSATGLPSGVTASFSPTSTATSSTLTLTASGTAATGTATVTITGISGSLTNTTTLFLTVTVAPPVSHLPSPWLDADIGSPGAAGSGNYANGTFTVNGAGLQLYGSADEFNFVYQTLTGDGSIEARLVSFPGSSNPFAVAGVMIRDTLAAGAANAKTAFWPVSKAIEFDLRATTGGTTNEPSGQSAALPYWIKVTRSGSSFTGYVSSDGVNWVQLGSSRTVTMGQSVYVGLAVCSGDTSALATATFDNVSVTTPPPPTPNFTLSALPSSLTVTQGTSGTSTISVVPQNGFNGNVSLSASGLPSGVSAAFNPSSTSGSSTLTLTATSTATMGTATITVTGTSGTLTNTTKLTLTVNAPPVPNFSLSASPASLTLTQGTSGTSTISVTPLNGFSGSVSLSATGMPSGVSASFNPTSTSGSSTLTLTASGTAATGTVTVTITGTSGSLTNSTSLSLTVNAVAAANFTLSASPNSLSIVQGNAKTSTITVTPVKGFSGSVSLSATGMPSGVTASFSPTSTTTSSTLTLSANGTATTGTVTVTITGTSGSLTNTTSLSLTVTAAPPPSGLPSPWVDGDIGATGVAGSATYANGTFTVNGAGLQIYGSSDEFSFVSQPLTGNGSIVARLVSLQAASNPYAVAGVMIRDTLAAGAANAKTAFWPVTKSIDFDLRTTTGGTTNEPSGVSAALPYWVKMTRSGNTFTAHVSSDGVNWVQMGSSWTIAMGQTVQVGLAVTSGSTSALVTATFDSVAVTVP